MKKSGLADSPFFAPPQKKMTATPLLPNDGQAKKNQVYPNKQKIRRKPANQPRHQATMVPGHHGTTVSRDNGAIIEHVRKAVKALGKEAATHRFTVEEKKKIAEIIFSYKNQGVRTSENELTRIAVNFLLGDYQENGKNSVLAKVLKALNE